MMNVRGRARTWGRTLAVCTFAVAVSAVPALAGNGCGPTVGFGMGWGGGWGGNPWCGPGWGGPGWYGPGWGYRPGVAIRVVRPVAVQPVYYQQRRRVIVLVPDPALGNAEPIVLGNGSRSIYASDQVAQVQSALNARGFNAGPVDGVPGQLTRSAIVEYQQAKGLPVTGQIDPPLLAALNSDPSRDVRAQAPSSPPPSTTTTPPPSQPAPSTGTKPQTQTNTTKYPTGIVVPEKPGYVNSPYAKDAGVVDVRGIESGTLVRCPYTSQIFIVP